MARWLCVQVGLVGTLAAPSPPGQAAEAAFRYTAPITLQQPAAFVRLPLPASAYGRSQQAGLADLRILDARGERVPFAVLAPRAGELQEVEQTRDVVLYPLPRPPGAGQPWPSPIEVVVEGDRISVKRVGGAATRPQAGAGPQPPALGTAAGAAAPVPGWLIDLGERRRDDPPTRALRMAWSGPAEFSAPYLLETSADLRQWHAAAGGQLMALASGAGALTQADVPLPADAGRFVRLAWLDAAASPGLTGAKAVAAQQRSTALDAPTELQFTATAEPAGTTPTGSRHDSKTPTDEADKPALHFDLGGALPLVQIDLQLTTGTRVAPVRVQGRSRVDEPWRDLAQGVFYRVERGTAVSTSPPLTLRATARYVRVVPDERSGALEANQTRLVVQAQLASLVFAAQGQAPFSLAAGSGDARASALPVGTLVSALEDERPRFGRASLGEWSEVAEVARQRESQQRQAALRPWLLWAVLLAGVAGLGFMVWRLVGSRAAG